MSEITELRAEVARLRKKLSPMLDPQFFAEFKAVEPVQFYRKSPVTYRRREAAYTVNLRQVWLATPGFTPNPSPLDLTKLGRCLDAIGWERTRRDGMLFFVMTLNEFAEVYGDR